MARIRNNTYVSHLPKLDAVDVLHYNICTMATISFRIDDNPKREAESILDALGLNMSTAMTMLTKAIVWKHGIPLDLTIDSFTPARTRPASQRLLPIMRMVFLPA